MSYSYAIKSSPLPLSDYKSTIKVEPKGEGMSTITWSSTFTPAAGKDVAGIYQSGLDSVKAKARM
jgi:Polyketide cyclase / dehydrase and lipid transport